MTFVVSNQCMTSVSPNIRPHAVAHTDVTHSPSTFRDCDPLDRLDEDGETEGEEEDGIDEGSQHFRPRPAVRVLRRRLLRYLNEGHFII